MPGMRCIGKIGRLLFAYVGITGCVSASLKLGTCNAASPWSQSPPPDSQWSCHVLCHVPCAIQHHLATETKSSARHRLSETLVSAELIADTMA